MSTERFLLILPLEFPEGIAPGAGSGYNRMQLARNGRGQPILRGTSLSGVIRHALQRQVENADLNNLFGKEADEKGDGSPSRLKIADCVLEIGKVANTHIRTHHLRDRHTKTVISKGLFSIESCPPGTQAEAHLWLDGQGIEGLRVLRKIVGLFQDGMFFGGSSARGIGRAILTRPARFRNFDLEKIDEHAAYLDMARSLHGPNRKYDCEGFEALGASAQRIETLQIKLRLRIPRGQDVLVADGRGTDFQLQPQYTCSADGFEQWRIPGSSLRGLLKSWMTKVAAKAGCHIADNHDRRIRFNEQENPDDAPNGENLGRVFLSAQRRQELAKQPERYKEIECPIARLFGSLYQASRITISDSLVTKRDSGITEQVRMHVAVDRITGGAEEGMLFDNTVLVADRPEASAFEFRISIREPQLNEVLWLRAALVALDIGLLRVGSSKSAGRLELSQSPEGTGPHADQLTNLVPNCARKR